MIYLPRSPAYIVEYLLTFAAIGLVTLWSAAASAMPSYRITPLGEPMNFEDYPDIAVMDLNNYGQIVGNIGSGYGAFIYEQELGFQTLGPNVDFAQKINDRGQILASSGFYDYFLLPGKQPVVSLPGIGETDAIDMNNAGQIVGSTQTIDYDSPYHAYLYTPSTGVTELLAAPGAPLSTESRATNINDVGDIVGLFPWQDTFTQLRLRDGTYIPLGNRSTTLLTPVEINNRREVILYQSGGRGRRITFLYTPDAGLVDINAQLGETHIWATDINNLGEFVGAIGLTPFIYSIDDGPEAITLLDDMTFLNPLEPEWVIDSFNLINDRGQIVAHARSTAQGGNRHLLLSPVLVTEPRTPALLLAGLLILGFAKRLRFSPKTRSG